MSRSFSFLLIASVICCFPLESARAAPCFLDQVSREMDYQIFQKGKFQKESIRDCESNYRYKMLKEFMRGMLVIGIKGFHGEQHLDYFGGLKQTVELLDGRFAAIDTNSSLPIDADVEERLCRDVSNFIGSSQKVLIVGHSKGGGSALYLFRHCAQVLAQPKVKAVISVSGVIRGSSYADWSVERNVALEKTAEEIVKYRKEISGNPMLNFFMGDTIAGISLTTRMSEERLKKLKPLSAVVRAKMFCVAGFSDPATYAFSSYKRARDMVKSASKIVSQAQEVGQRDSRNDGLVDFVKQFDPELCPLRFVTPGVHHLALLESDSVDPSLQAARQSYAAALLVHAMAFAAGR